VILLAAAFAQAYAAPPAANPSAMNMSDAEFCSIMSAISKEMTNESPKMVDHITRMDGMVTLCSVRAVAWNKSVLTAAPADPEQWRLRHEANWTAGICQNALYRNMSLKGWEYVQYLTFRTGEHLTLNARCK
jgi:hypothetical protein